MVPEKTPDFALWRVDFDGVAYVVARDKYTAERIAARHASEECQPYAREARSDEKAYEWHESLPYFEGDAPHEKTVGQLIAELKERP